MSTTGTSSIHIYTSAGSTAATTCPKSSTAAIGAGVGVGLGVPLLVSLAGTLWLATRRKYEKSQTTIPPVLWPYQRKDIDNINELPAGPDHERAELGPGNR